MLRCQPKSGRKDAPCGAHEDGLGLGSNPAAWQCPRPRARHGAASLGRRLLDELNLLLHQAVEIVYESINLAVGGLALALPDESVVGPSGVSQIGSARETLSLAAVPPARPIAVPA